MISKSDLESMVQILSEALPVIKNNVSSPLAIVRKNQTGERTAYPFGAYQVISDAKVYDHQASVFSMDAFLPNGQVDPTKIQLEKRKLTYAVVSFEINSNSFGEARMLAGSAWDFIDSRECLKAFRNIQLTPSLVSTEIQDRTLVLPGMTTYEYRYGFDFKIETYKTKTTTVDSVNPISNQVTLEE
jgi:hypothetical protein